MDLMSRELEVGDFFGSDHIACDCHFISFVMEGKTIDFKSSCFSGSACMKLSYLRSSGSTGAVNEIFIEGLSKGL